MTVEIDTPADEVLNAGGVFRPQPLSARRPPVRVTKNERRLKRGSLRDKIETLDLPREVLTTPTAQKRGQSSAKARVLGRLA